jgi:hypothetical protein
MSGFTDEEKFLNNLGEKSFLKFWSWPNLFRDQCKNSNAGDGKEICDLTIVFGKNVLLFSDKKISFNTTKQVEVAWTRWARKAIKESVKQIRGARRWLLEYPDRVFIDKACDQIIPIKLPKRDEVKFHNIVVCHGIEEELYSISEECSFIIDNQIQGEQHWSLDGCKPFYIGKILDEGFFHVFNEATIELVLNEFDTIKDFISYLENREKLITSTQLVRIQSESDIVQLFYENFNEEQQEYSILDTVINENHQIIIDKGGINELWNNPAFVIKKNQDEISYFWDSLIESFSIHILNGTSENNNWDSINDIEPGIRKMAQSGRFERRVLADAFLTFYFKTLPEQRGTRLFIDPTEPDLAYLFLILPFVDSFKSNEEYKQKRLAMLMDYCMINKLRGPSIKFFVAIGCKTRSSDTPLTQGFFNEGQDYTFADFSEWDLEGEQLAQEIHDEYVDNGLLASTKRFEGKITEFPEVIDGRYDNKSVGDIEEC